MGSAGVRLEGGAGAERGTHLIEGWRVTDRERRLVVCIHDVAPPFERAITRQIERLQSLGVSRCVLNVVPNWHGQHPLHRHPQFCALLRAVVERGNQIVLHGCEHRPRGRLRGPARLRARAALFAPHAAEFLTLPPAFAARGVDEGRHELHAVGLPAVDAFCAPGWLIDREVSNALVDGGIRYIAGMLSLRDLWTGEVHWLPSLGYMGAGGWQEAGVGLMNAGMDALAARRAETVMVYLHPQGDQEGAPAERVYGTIARLVSVGRKPVTFGELVAS
jgi:predicted deacetylase